MRERKRGEMGTTTKMPSTRPRMAGVGFRKAVGRKKEETGRVGTWFRAGEKVVKWDRQPQRTLSS